MDSAAAVSAGEIATALSKSSVSARLAGMSMDELIASVSVIGEVTQNSMDSVGVAMKSLLARYGNVKAGVFSSMGLDDDGETTENINDIEKVLGKLGIRVRSSNLEMRSLSDVLDELNEKWSTYDTVTKNAISTAFGGTRQRENFLVLMENYNRYKELTEESANAAGTADKKYEAYMDSMEAATKRLTNAWEEFTLKLQSSNLMKLGINFLAGVVENMDKIVKLATILTPLLAGKRIKAFIGNTWEKGKGFFDTVKGGLGFGVKQTSFIKNESGKIISTSVGKGESAIVKSGFAQLHQDLEELIGVTKGNVMGTAAEVGAKAIGKNKFQVGDDVTAEWDSVNKRWRGRNIATGKFTHLTPEQLQSLPDMQSIAGAKFGFFRSRTLKGVTLADGTKLTTRKGNWFDSTGNSIKLTETQQKEVAAAITQNKENYAAALKSAIPSALVMGGLTGLIMGWGQKSYAGGDSLGARLARVTGVKSGAQQVESKGGSIAKGVAAGLGAGVSMLPSPWNLIGVAISTLGPAAIDFFDTWIHRDELERKERSEQAQKQLDALNGIQSTIEDSADLMSKDVWVSDDYKAFKEYIDNLSQSYLDMESDFSGATDTFIANFNEAAEKLEIGAIKIGNINDLYDQLADANIEVRKKAQRAVQLANLQAQREQYIGSQEDTRYNAYKAMSGVDVSSLDKYFWAGTSVNATQTAQQALKERYQSIRADSSAELIKEIEVLKKELKQKGTGDIFVGSDKLIEDLDSQIDKIKKAQAEIDTYNKKVAEMDTQIGILAADIWDFSDKQLNALTMDGVVGKVVKAMELQGVEVRNAAGYIKDEYLSAIKAAIKENSKFSTLLKGDTRTMYQLSAAAKKFTDVFGKDNSYADLKDKLDRGESINFEGSGYSDDELAEIVYAADPSKIQNFARAWNTNVEGAKALAERFKDLSTAEGLLSTTEILDKYSKLNSIFEDLADNGRLTTENLENMIKLYPQFITEGGSIADLYDKVTKQKAVTYFNAIQNQLMTSEDIGKKFQESIADDENFKNISTDLAKSLGKNGLTLSNILEIAQNYESGGDTKTAELLRNKVKSMLKKIDVEWEDLTLQKAVEYREKIWEKQISNLEEQKEALSQINDEREKELNLMKAQEQLENARKEKKMVYREGIGFVYEADESAILEAQKNLEDLDTQKRQDAIQSQIDAINYLKETMENIDADATLDKLENIYEEYLKANNISLDNNTQAAIFLAEALTNQKVAYDPNTGKVTFSDGKTQETGGGVSGAIAGTAETANSNLNEFNSAAGKLKSAYAALSEDSLNAANIKKGTTAYSQRVEQYNKALSDYDKAKEAVGDSKNAEYLNMANELSGYGKIEDSNYILYDGVVENPQKGKNRKGTGYGKWRHDGLKLFKNAPMGIPGDFDGHSDHTSVKKYLGNNKWGEWEALMDDWKTLPNYSIVANEWGKDEYNFVLDGALRKLVDAKTGENASGYARGTLSKSSSDLSYINELGTEAIITPSGTLTALPSKTGIIPADITKNLWGLGEVAPNLVGMLDSLKQQRFDTEAKTITNEEGVYIDRLDMSIYPKEGYNMDEFISQLRAKAALTRQNN